MTQLQQIGQEIRQCRLAKNLRMDDVARKANISRVTLYNIEKGNENYSISAILNVLQVLNLYFKLGNLVSNDEKRIRATRQFTLHDKKINRFIVMCVEKYAESIKEPSELVYKEMKEKGIIEYLVTDYEDLHGMSTAFINQLIGGLLEKKIFL